MARMRTAAALTRVASAALLALFLALRVLASSGYMPEVQHGRLTLMLCPDGEWTAPATAMAGMNHDHGHKTTQHQQCPYAVAAAMSFASGDSAQLSSLLAFVFLFLALCAPPSLARTMRFERPYSTGPPLPA